MSSEAFHPPRGRSLKNYVADHNYPFDSSTSFDRLRSRVSLSLFRFISLSVGELFKARPQLHRIPSPAIPYSEHEPGIGDKHKVDEDSQSGVNGARNVPVKAGMPRNYFRDSSHCVCGDFEPDSVS